MFGVLIPLFIDALGEMVYELVQMGIEQFKDWMKDATGGGECPAGTKVAMMGPDGNMHCFDYDPRRIIDQSGTSAACANYPGSTFKGINESGGVICGCPPPKMWHGDFCMLPRTQPTPPSDPTPPPAGGDPCAAVGPGYYNTGTFTADGRPICACKNGYEPINGVCVKVLAPVSQPGGVQPGGVQNGGGDPCSNAGPGYYNTGGFTADGRPICGCKAGYTPVNGTCVKEEEPAPRNGGVYPGYPTPTGGAPGGYYGGPGGGTFGTGGGPSYTAPITKEPFRQPARQPTTQTDGHAGHQH